MKEGWTYKKIGDVFKTYAGGTPSKSNKANYENGSIPWIRSGEVCKKYITESELFISEEGLKNSSAKYYPINTVLIAMYGATAAQCGILKFEATSNQAVCGILPREGISPEFVYAYFTYIKEYLAAQAQGGAQPNISQEKVKKVLFPCIPHSEQLSIVARLDATFAHIDALKANAEKQLAEAHHLFQAELTEYMRPKEGEEKRMEEVAIKDICSKVSSALKQKELLAKGKYPVYGASGIAGYMDYYHQENAYIGIVKDGSGIGRVAFYPEKTSLIGTMQYILPKKGFDIKYIGYCLQSLDLSKYKQGAAIPHIYFRDYGERLVKVTNDDNEQRSIVSRLDALSANIKKLEEVQRKTLAECDALKQAMLREVFE